MSKKYILRKNNKHFEEDKQIIGYRSILTKLINNHKEYFTKFEYNILLDAKKELVIRDRFPLRKLPRSWNIWGPAYFLTFHLPRRVANWKYRIRKCRLRSIKESIDNALFKVLSNNGQYSIYYYTYPHRTSSGDTNASIHFHCVLCAVRNKIKRNRNKDKLDEWKEMNENDKANTILELFKDPLIEMDGNTIKNINNEYCNNLRSVFGASSLFENLVWVSEQCILTEKAHRNVARYMRNPIRNLTRKKHIRYDDDHVFVRDLITEKGEYYIYGQEQAYDFITFARKYILLHLEGFAGCKFYPKGGYHGVSRFNKILKYVYEHQEVATKLGWGAISYPEDDLALEFLVEGM